MISIHNNPENLQLPAKIARLQFALADVDTQDISPFFAPSYDFIEEARAAGHGGLYDLQTCPSPLTSGGVIVYDDCALMTAGAFARPLARATLRLVPGGLEWVPTNTYAYTLRKV